MNLTDALGWTLLNWIAVTVTMQFTRSAFTFALGYCIHILFGNLAVVFVVKRLIPEAKLWPRIRAGMLCALVTGLVARGLLLPWAQGVVSLTAAVLAAITVFAVAIAVFDRSALLELWAMMRKRRKSAIEGA